MAPQKKGKIKTSDFVGFDGGDDHELFKAETPSKMATFPSHQSANTSRPKAASTLDKWPTRDLFRNPVTLVVGAKKKSYTLHKDLLIFYSDFFRAALYGSFKEAEEQRVELPEVDEEVFETFQLWLYTRRLDHAEVSFMTITRLWVFADQHQIPLLQNYAMDLMFERRVKKNCFDTSTINFVYNNTVAGSHLRRAVIEISTSLVNSPGAHERPEHWTVESLIDLVRAVDSRLKDLKQYSLPKRDKCFFHVHGKDEEC
ncbi:hypothetical protein AUEXF2481DRAFT_31217 [Aureobasidium subglaciale EXF-2481]|uniref:BTB domain-containing protein n=1 Tax=Aureobasidium subglaciale (strain EXF-2481) TaxID=1043005 RepID=A0A074YHV5_AURSE|nr:uncharacterized protein AUEXF2481DRAFT_31217 [Aureobasidium subglaciale EXF-2481]KAI5212715.1 hypothetical protein E4T38_00042 [Aureobasidium subglaciale]KAI5232585.1 hypothetical protein E4T40_00042 [Aureobasidium subglaciale]KAI5234772.1 hypothetical protein E4T41_00042 [Aureobasidium subglaciale]KAI5268265.1 hypothetical protein E4T46_00042 [Aureobasidium subglaciale]KEQ93652.1 hypothetical protein AUEXF2481DRAFT_31217 [Aureobasidium subglaciale EXF-2481]